MIESSPRANRQPEGHVTPSELRILDRAARVAIIGAGLMGRWHARAIRRAGGRIVAVVDSNIDRARSLADGAATATSAEELLSGNMSDKPIDVIHVCTPGETHFKFVHAALESGAHVMVETPIIDSAFETKMLFDLAAAKGLYVCPVHQFPFQRGIARATKLLSSLGPVHDIAFTICSEGDLALDAEGLDATANDILPHPFSVLRFLWPETALCPSDWTAFRSAPGNLHVAGPYDRAQMTVTISMHARPTSRELVIRCTKGTIAIDFVHGFASIERGGVSRLSNILRPFKRADGVYLAASLNLVRRAIAREPAYPGLLDLVQRFYGAIGGKGPVPIETTDTIAVAEARTAVMEKAVYTKGR